MRRIIVAGFFVVVFGFPVAWYLILQLFGENKFDIPVYDAVSNECKLHDGAYLQLNPEVWGAHKNELNRITRKFESVDTADVLLIPNADCLQDTATVLVDAEGHYRGFYGASREETDRILTEIDIYLNNLVKDGSGE